MTYDPSTKRNWTAAQLEAFKPRGKRYDILSDRYPGLRLRVQPSGRKAWVVEYRADGRRRTYTIGPFPQWSHANAAKHAAKAFGKSADPQAAKQQGRERLAVERAQAATVGEFLEGDYWNGRLKLARDGEATRNRIRNVFGPLLKKPLWSITGIQLEDHLTKRLGEVSVSTVRRDKAAIQGLFSYAVKRKVVEVNPAAAVELPKADNNEEPRYLSASERGRLMAALADDQTPEYLRDLVILALNTGLRRSEMFSLDWKDVDLDRGQITVRGAKSKSGNTRHISINKPLAEMLERRGKASGQKGYVIPNPETGNALVDVKKGWAKLLQRARIKDFRLHDLRHSFASQLVQRGVPLYTVQKLLGHSSMAMTARYSHLAQDDLAAAVAVLDG